MQALPFRDERDRVVAACRSLADAGLVHGTAGNVSVRAGDHIVTHCRFGIGRASLLAASILVLNGLPPDQVWERLEQARGLAVLLAMLALIRTRDERDLQAIFAY